MTHSSAPAPAGPSPDRVIWRDGLRTRSVAPGTGLPRCGSRVAPRSPARRRPAVRSPGATWRSSRSTCRGRSTVAGQPCSAVSGSPSAWVASIAPSRSRNSTGTFDVKPDSACATANRAVGRCPTSGLRAAQGIPVNAVSNRLQRVTQWMSCVTSTVGSSFSSCHVNVTGVSTSPKTRKSQPARSAAYVGTEPA